MEFYKKKMNDEIKELDNDSDLGALIDWADSKKIKINTESSGNKSVVLMDLPISYFNGLGYKDNFVDMTFQFDFVNKSLIGMSIPGLINIPCTDIEFLGDEELEVLIKGTRITIDLGRLMEI